MWFSTFHIENQASSIQHSALEGAFEVTFLDGSDRVIDDHEVGFPCLYILLELVDFSLADKGCGMWFIAYGMHDIDYFSASRFNQKAGFLHVKVGFEPGIGLVQYDGSIRISTVFAIVPSGVVYSLKQGYASIVVATVSLDTIDQYRLSSCVLPRRWRRDRPSEW